MRHAYMEHLRARPEPFTICGDLAFILRSLSMREDMTCEEASAAFSDGEAELVCAITGKRCVIIKWASMTVADGAEWTIEAMPIWSVKETDYAPPVDQWVVVGTTAVDGTHAELSAAFNVSKGACGPCIHGLIDGERVVEVRGRHR